MIFKKFVQIRQIKVRLRIAIGIVLFILFLVNIKGHRNVFSAERSGGRRSARF